MKSVAKRFYFDCVCILCIQIHIVNKMLSKRFVCIFLFFSLFFSLSISFSLHFSFEHNTRIHIESNQTKNQWLQHSVWPYVPLFFFILCEIRYMYYFQALLYKAEYALIWLYVFGGNGCGNDSYWIVKRRE